ncbi:MAG: 2-hydroxyacid dehydrogenase [Thaumarchaeota archaeon]|nr:2-hydroxyacid dehydrogenase [Nitrososphaerota archaeon]
MSVKLLLGPSFPEEEIELLREHAQVLLLSEMGDGDLDAVLPKIDCLLVHFWPERLDAARVSKMTRLSLVQTGLAGVNHIPFGALRKTAVVCSNAGGFSDEVGEHAWGLLLAAAKRVVKFDAAMRRKGFKAAPALELGRDILVLKGRTLGIVGYGGIGRKVAQLGRAFGMNVVAFSRSRTKEPGIVSVRGRSGLERVLRESDAAVIALPLTKSTRGMIGEEEISMMKPGAILVNVARAEIVDEGAIYRRLVADGKFVYATDVWWMKEGKESYAPELPFLKLENFIGTPHVSGPSAAVTSAPQRRAVKNLLRFLGGEEPLNVVDGSEYA